MNAQPEKTFIRNKAAQVFALTFVMEYLTVWPEFFFDVLSLVGLNPHGVDVYLRTLMAIDGEVVDRDIMHTPEVSRSAGLTQRGGGASAHGVLWTCPPGDAQEHPDQRHHEGAVHPQPGGVLVPDPDGLPAVPPGAHLSVSGSGGGLRVLDRPEPHRQRAVSGQNRGGGWARNACRTFCLCCSFVNLLLGQMSMEELREEACDCLFEIINKGMDPVDKTKLVESLCRVLQAASFFNVEQVSQRVTMETFCIVAPVSMSDSPFTTIGLLVCDPERLLVHAHLRRSWMTRTLT